MTLGVGPTSAGRAPAGMREHLSRAMAGLEWEPHPLLFRDVCVLEHAGDLVVLDFDEIDEMLGRILASQIDDSSHETDRDAIDDLDRRCVMMLARTATDTPPARWRIA